MADDGIIRAHATLQVTITAGTAVSSVIDMRPFATMTIHMPAAWTGATIGFRFSSTRTGVYLPLYDVANAIEEIAAVVVDRAYLTPDLGAVRFVQLWSQNAGVDVLQVLDRVLTVDLKA